MNLWEPDRQYLIEAIPQLQEYLLSPELYWPLRGDLPRLSPGNLLFTINRLQHVEFQEKFQPEIAQFILLRENWRAAWHGKGMREFSNRLRLWGQCISDYSRDQDRLSFRNDVRGRAILQLLLNEFPGIPETDKLALEEYDRYLKKIFLSGDFIWDIKSQHAFLLPDFWFLYGNLQ